MADFRAFEEIRVPVRGGELAVLRWPAADPGAPTAVLVHGITANALAWAAVAEAVDGRVNLLALDLRGRAHSRDLAAPFGIDVDVQDTLALLDHAGLERAVLAGHSLGAFVVCALAARHPDRVRSLLAVDGGVRLAPAPQTDPDEVLENTVGPAIRKLRMTFADGEAYLDFHREHPAFVGNWSAQLTAYLGRDTLRRPDGKVVSSCVAEAIRADGRQLIVDEFVRGAINTLNCPVALLYAERGILNQPQGLYDADTLTAAGLDRSRVTVTLIPDTNHYTIVGPGAGADRVAAELVEQTAREQHVGTA
ncbi:alpha/beta hydrolase [Actinocrinis puniceicyclus]|uniref:Alpha/beta hydrolase n=1 Tax=Actinocrinis puniceicyclus TaxID=977794 RepID=A0A8J7WMX1_9ACTN|nr:alpha/beta hydrolase [Actinocrinis puniceicyclus]MBS2962672.1 alpha/beta hydrolase [Actinocrinis puniceicyclus]